jgi:hypothetical protein
MDVKNKVVYKNIQPFFVLHTLKIKNMKHFFSQLFNDNNTINEKSVVGFLAFVMMVIFAGADIVTGTLGKELVIQEFIFNAFMWLTLGSFGIGSVDKWINKGKEKGE